MNHQYSTMRTVQFLMIFLFLSACTGGNTPENEQEPTADTEKEITNESLSGVEQSLLENDHVNVLKVTLKPEESLPWHRGGPRVIYSASDYSVRFKQNPDDKTSQQESFKKGELHWHSKNTHSVKNTGSTKAEFIVFMRKPGSFPEQADYSAKSDLAEEMPDDADVVLENEAVKVINVTLDGGQEVPMHQGVKRLVYSLKDYSLRFNTPNDEAEKQDFEAGDVHWHEGGAHAIENTGDETAEFLLIKFKK